MEGQQEVAHVRMLPRVRSSRQLRENYIINRHQDYNRLTGEVHRLMLSPQFNRFIPSKKSPMPKLTPQKQQQKPQVQPRRRTLESNFSRRQLFLMRQRRPDHNSPLKQRRKEEEQKENAMLIKQLVTHIEQPVGIVTPLEDPYSPRSASKYYVAQVVKHYQETESIVREHLFCSLYFLQLLQNYAVESGQPPVSLVKLPQNEKYHDKLTVVFDLDETLVHCFQELSEPHQVEILVRFENGGMMVAPLNIRPQVREVLAELSHHFELMVFTASHQSYADAVLDYLDPQKKLIQHRLYRQHCQYLPEGYYVKDLRVLGRDLTKVVLVDNAAYSYSFQVDNGIPILPYYEGSTDFELKALRNYLMGLTGDVRQANRKAFRLSQYIRFDDVELLVSQLYL